MKEEIDLLIELINELSTKTRINKDELYRIVLEKVIKTRNEEQEIRK